MKSWVNIAKGGLTAWRFLPKMNYATFTQIKRTIKLNLRSLLPDIFPKTHPVIASWTISVPTPTFGPIFQLSETPPHRIFLKRKAPIPLSQPLKDLKNLNSSYFHPISQLQKPPSNLQCCKETGKHCKGGASLHRGPPKNEFCYHYPA